MTKKEQRWVFHRDTEAQAGGENVIRRVLAYCDGLMCVENTFEKGAIVPLHRHPHIQITYVVSGEFTFAIDGETKIVTRGDTMLTQDSMVHSCTCLEEGVLLDIFTPMREDFV